MYVKACMWNLDVVERKEREFRALVKKYEPDVVIATELKTVDIAGVAGVWSADKLEVISSLRKGVRAALRAGVAILVIPGLKNSVRHVRNEVEERTTGVVQKMEIELRGGVRITGAYLSPTVSVERTTFVLRGVIEYSTGHDVLMGDLNERHYTWDITTNPKGWELVAGTKGNI